MVLLCCLARLVREVLVAAARVALTMTLLTVFPALLIQAAVAAVGLTSLRRQVLVAPVL